MNTNDEDNNENKKMIFGVSLPVFIMGLVSLFTDISSELIQSILPLFIISIGGSFLILGLIFGVTTAISNILKGFSGWLSDKVNKRKPFVVAGYAISNFSKPFIAFSPSWEYVLGLKALDRFGKGLRTSSRDVLISYYAIEKGRAFGLHRSMDTLGAVIGSLLAFIFLYWAWTYSEIIFFSIIPGIIAVIFILFIKDVNPKELDESKLKYPEQPKVDEIDRNFVKLIIILGVIEFASLDIAFLIIRSTDFISIELIFLIPLFYLISNVLYTIFSPITGTISDKIGRKPVIIFGLSLLLISCLLLAVPITISLFSLILIIIIFSMYGIYMASVDPISRAYIADLAGANKRGRAYGYYYLSVGLISLGESLIFGLIYELFTYTAAFLYTSILLLICIIIFSATDFSKIIQKKH
ncbi:MAG: MFS transporter [Promethearchaeota archaeon]|nr:MAG: MFS transporter [Candidatus Lokiarchaeota archaeon]